MRGRCVRVRSWWLFVGTALAWACGHDEASSDGGVGADGALLFESFDASRSDAAGMDARSANDGSAGKADANAYANLSARAACQLYVEQFCQRWGACTLGDSTACLNRVQQCPDLAFATGSTRTPGQVAACAERWASASCAEVSTGGLDCSTPGTRAPGESCLFPSQCSSLVCSNAGASSCGVCQATRAEGQACSVTEPCNARLVCLASVCSKPVAVAEAGRFAAGEACSEARGCVTGSVCRVEDAGVASGRRCLGLPGVGEPCWSGQCAAGLYCTRSNLCKLPPAVGQPCATDEGSGQGKCAADAYCESGSCKPGVGAGGACGGNAGSCGVGLQCLESNANGLGSCLRVQNEGGSCADAYERCARGSECRAGRCEAVASLGLFQSVCSP